MHILKKLSLDVAFKGKVSSILMHVNDTEKIIQKVFLVQFYFGC